MFKKSIVAAFALAMAFTASAAMDFGSATLRVGSRGMYVSNMQSALNACTGSTLATDGIYGRGTGAAVRAFQASKGLSADGVVGNATKAALANCSTTTTSTTTTTTTTTTPTTTTTTPVAGCTPGAMFSSTTGQACGTTTTTTPAVMTGNGEGTLTNISKLGSFNSTKVSESDKDVKVLGIEVTAKDGDQKIDGLNIAFNNSNGSSSKKFTKYVSEVSVWLDGVEIGRKLASAYSDDASDIYTYRFTGMNGVVKQNMKGQIVVAVSAVGSMDSTDATNESTTVFVGATVGGTDDNYISALSANGRYRDFGTATATSTIDFQKAGGVSSDQKFKVTTAASNPIANTMQVSRTSDTNGVTLLAFDVKAENGAMKIQKLPVTVTATSSGTGVAPFTGAIAKTLYLFADGKQIASESTPQDGTDSASETIIFGNTSKLNLAIAANATVKFEVKADLNDIEASTANQSTEFDEGDQLNVSYTTTNVTNSTVELDNFNQDTVSNRTGSATGELQTARSTGGLVTMGATSYSFTPNTSGSTNNKTIIKIPVTVKAFDDTLYVGQTAAAALTGTIANQVGFSYTLNNGTAPSTQVLVIPSGATTAPTSTISSTATTSGSAWRIDSGTSQTFNIEITLSGATAAASMRVQLQDFQFYTDNALTTGEVIQSLAPMSSFQSVYSPIF
jgi:peptidoglycan hydrolase-like protein with peptidoglycan-binding domain